MRLLCLLVLNPFLVCSGFGQSYTVSTFAGGPPHPAARAANAAIGSPVGVMVDTAGNVYFFSLHCVFKVDPSGVLTRIAGNYTAGYSGDGGPATGAQLNSPLLIGYYGLKNQDVGLAVDGAGNVYIPDPVAGRVRKVSTSGIITTVAGNGITGAQGVIYGAAPGDGGPATNAAVNSPHHLACDSDGNLYIAEYGFVRKVTPDGIIHTVAGGGSKSGDGLPAVDVFLSVPAGIAVDGAGNLYIAIQYKVWKVSAAGIITTFAGTSQTGYTGDGGPATSAQLQGANDVAVDAAGNVYIADIQGYYIRKVSPDGIITTVAGNGGWGFAGDGVPAIGAPVAPEGLAADRAGNLYVADFDASRIRKISADGIIGTVAGNGGQLYAGDGGPATQAVLSSPGQLAVDKAGSLYIADRGNNRVRQVSPDGTITTVAGNGNAASSGDGGPAIDAGLARPSGVTFDSAGNLYIVEAGGFRKVSPAGVISTVPGTAFSRPPLPPTSEPLEALSLFSADSRGNLYYVDNGIQKRAPDGTSTFVGGRNYIFGGLTIDGTDGLYYADILDNVVVRISSTGTASNVTTKVGNGCQTGFGFPFPPYGLALDGAGNLYIADANSSTIRRITPAGTMETIAGNFTSGYSGDGGPATFAQLAQPTSIAVDGAGNIYVADPIDNLVRVLRPSPPAAVSVGAVTNGASNLTGPVAPGEIVTIYGSGLGPAPLVACTSGAAGLIDTQLNDTHVFFNGTPARLIYTSAGQVAAVVPYSLALGTAQVRVAFQDGTSALVPVAVDPSAPALFTTDGTGKGQAAAINRDGSINSARKPARPGEFISLYATGEGQTSPSGVDGQPAANPLPHPILPVTVTIGGQTLQPQYAGGAPGYFAGLMQVNVQIPAGMGAGSAVPVSMQVGKASSPAGVTIAVAGN